MVHVLNNIKKEVCNAKFFGLYDSEKELRLEVDASQKGLGACLLQDKFPISFASKSLTPAERNYSNIEYKCLAVVFGLEHFRQFIFGGEVIIRNNQTNRRFLLITNYTSTSLPTEDVTQDQHF